MGVATAHPPAVELLPAVLGTQGPGVPLMVFGLIGRNASDELDKLCVL